MSLLRKLTIVVPTYNRQRFALRNMKFWSGSDVTVHVLDGTATAIDGHLLQGIGPNVVYHHMPIPFSDRLGGSARLVATDYAMLLGDDEFYLPRGLEICIAALENDPSLVSCAGRCLAFWKAPAGIAGSAFYPAMKDYAITQNTPLARIMAHMRDYTPSTIYSVCRAPIWSMAIRTFAKPAPRAFGAGELRFALAVCHAGRSKVLPVLMWLRSRENEALAGTTPDNDSRYTFSQWWHDPRTKAERDEFIAGLADVIAEADGGAAEPIARDLRDALSVYVESCDVSDIRARRNADVCSKTAALAPRAVKDVLKWALSGSRFAIDPPPPLGLADAGRNLAASGVRCDASDLAAAEAAIATYYAEAA